MNRNVVAIILLVLAAVLFFLYGWPKIKPYVSTGGGGGEAPEMTTSPTTI